MGPLLDCLPTFGPRTVETRQATIRAIATSAPMSPPVLVYIGGPMTGLPNYNFTAFFEAEHRLWEHGFQTVNPAQHDIDMGWVTVVYDGLGGILSVNKKDENPFSWATALDWDLDQIAECDALYLLPGWSHSRGATKEYRFAKDRGLYIWGSVHEAPAPTKDQPLVGLIGYAQAGKDTVGQALDGYRRMAFADPLKALALFMNPLTEGAGGVLTSLSRLVESVGWEKAKNASFDAAFGTRPYLQRLGMGVREILGNDTWVQAAFATYDPTQPTVFTDVRFPNEVEAIRGRGGAICRVTRVGLNPPNRHVSEHLAANFDPDFQIIANEGDIASLAAQAVELDNFLRRA